MPTIEQLERFLAAEPCDPFVLYALALAHAKAGDRERAVEFHDKCLGEDPEYLYAYYHKARALEGLGRVEEAIATLEAARGHAKRLRESKALSEISGYLGALKSKVGAGWQSTGAATGHGSRR